MPRVLLRDRVRADFAGRGVVHERVEIHGFAEEGQDEPGASELRDVAKIGDGRKPGAPADFECHETACQIQQYPDRYVFIKRAVEKHSLVVCEHAVVTKRADFGDDCVGCARCAVIDIRKRNRHEIRAVVADCIRVKCGDEIFGDYGVLDA